MSDYAQVPVFKEKKKREQVEEEDNDIPRLPPPPSSSRSRLSKTQNNSTKDDARRRRRKDKERSTKLSKEQKELLISAKISAGICGGCGKELVKGMQRIKALNLSWHPECFCCLSCKKQLMLSGRFYVCCSIFMPLYSRCAYYSLFATNPNVSAKDQVPYCNHECYKREKEKEKDRRKFIEENTRVKDAIDWGGEVVWDREKRDAIKKSSDRDDVLVQEINELLGERDRRWDDKAKEKKDEPSIFVPIFSDHSPNSSPSTGEMPPVVPAPFNIPPIPSTLVLDHSPSNTGPVASAAVSAVPLSPSEQYRPLPFSLSTENSTAKMAKIALPSLFSPEKSMQVASKCKLPWDGSMPVEISSKLKHTGYHGNEELIAKWEVLAAERTKDEDAIAQNADEMFVAEYGCSCWSGSRAYYGAAVISTSHLYFSGRADESKVKRRPLRFSLSLLNISSLALCRPQPDRPFLPFITAAMTSASASSAASFHSAISTASSVLLLYDMSANLHIFYNFEFASEAAATLRVVWRGWESERVVQRELQQQQHEDSVQQGDSSEAEDDNGGWKVIVDGGKVVDIGHRESLEQILARKEKEVSRKESAAPELESGFDGGGVRGMEKEKEKRRHRFIYGEGEREKKLEVESHGAEDREREDWKKLVNVLSGDQVAGTGDALDAELRGDRRDGNGDVGLQSPLSVSPAFGKSFSPTPSNSPSPSATQPIVTVLEKMLLSEQDYVMSLRLLYDSFLISLLETRSVSDKQLMSLFANIPAILSAHRAVLLDWDERYLKGSLKDDIAELLETTIPALASLYLTYCFNLPFAKKTYASLLSSKNPNASSFRQFVRSAAQRCGSELSRLMMEPVRRLFEYYALLSELFLAANKNARSRLFKAREALEAVLDQIIAADEAERIFPDKFLKHLCTST